jgi:hypothetical protein
MSEGGQTGINVMATIFADFDKFLAKQLSFFSKVWQKYLNLLIPGPWRLGTVVIEFHRKNGRWRVRIPAGCKIQKRIRKFNSVNTYL